VEGNISGLIWGIILALSWRDWGKQKCKSR